MGSLERENGDVGLERLRERTGLTPRRIRYAETKGYLGEVRRGPKGHRRFDPEQAAFLERFAALTAAGLDLGEAALIARAEVLGIDSARRASLHALVLRLSQDAQRSLQAMHAVWGLLAPVDPSRK